MDRSATRGVAVADSFEYNIDSRNKLGGAVEWEQGDDFDNFVRLLNSGAVVRADGLAGVAGEPADLSVDAAARAELIAKLSEYR
jgi:hypothetical protein